MLKIQSNRHITKSTIISHNWIYGLLVFCCSFLVDNTPIRVFKNAESLGVPFPKNQAMRIYSSLWNADDWATRGGLVKTDWSKAPFTAYYRNFNVIDSKSSKTFSDSQASWQTNALDAPSRRRLRWVQKYFMIYNYCTDLKRFPQGFPAECRNWSFQLISLNGWLFILYYCLCIQVWVGSMSNKWNLLSTWWGEW